MTPLEVLPEHLKDFITEQDPSLYTWIDHAVWRYVMKVSKAYFAKVGHPLYVQGLSTTGISTERVPLISEMDQALRHLGWRAIAINGFIPPAVFLEFQSLKVLAIACDIRKLENIGYTPSPDIIHEAAGHVPIVADPEYRNYLEAYGEVARNAIITRHDLDIYEAVFNLSEIKEDPHSTPEQISGCQRRFEEVSKREVRPSEAALLTRMAWWTTEYGLIEVNGTPLIYGAGLLSSISESYHCLSDEVRKVPFSVRNCINTSYDITRPQPQLFVAKSFSELTEALEEFARTMAYRQGGSYGLRLGVDAQNTVTAELDTGHQLTGVLKDAFFTPQGEEAGFVLSGQKQFSQKGKASTEIPLGDLQEEILMPLFDAATAALSIDEIKRLVKVGGLISKTGLWISGDPERTITLASGAEILLLRNAKITGLEGRLIASSGSFLYPLIVSSKITSVFGGAADRTAFLALTKLDRPKVQSHKTNLTPANAAVNKLYGEVRSLRESRAANADALARILDQLDHHHSEDWLLRVEILELLKTVAPGDPMIARVIRDLRALSLRQPGLKEFIERGLECL